MSDEAEIGQGHLSDFGNTEKDYPVIATTSEMLSTGVDLPTAISSSSGRSGRWRCSSR